MNVRAAREDDRHAWVRMRGDLWPDGALAEHDAEARQYFRGEFPRGPWQVLVAERDGEPVGFAEVSIRPYAEGCVDSRIAYLEGWYVRPDARGTGVGRALVRAAEAWGRERGCREFASDAAPDNEASIAAHRAVGFEDAGLVRCFRKAL